MNLVEPIRNKSKLEELKEELKKSGTRNYMLFYTGINTGLRISDIVRLTRDDIRDVNGNIKSHISLVEKKIPNSKWSV